MSLATPRWWYRRTGAPAALRMALAPLSWVWAGATARRLRTAKPYDTGICVISVGNLTLGGAGKTPVTREILHLLRGRDVEAFALARGYGGREKGPLLVRPQAHTAAHVGDEPLLLSRDSPVIIARDRAQGARLAVSLGAKAVVMDDAHQNPALKKTLSLIVVDGETRDAEWPFGDGSVFPAGPMREPLAVGLARADAVVILAPPDLGPVSPELLALFEGKPVLIARLDAEPAPPGALFGFAGVAKPWKVERSLRAAGADLRGFVGLPDHGEISDDQLAHLRQEAARLGARLVTTEKDLARLGPDRARDILAFPVRARFEDEPRLLRLLQSALGGAGLSL